MVVFENTAAGSVVGEPAAPYLTRLAAGGANFVRSYAITHPSQPNYLDLFSGSDQGITDDSCPHTFSTPNLASELLAKHRTFAGYSEDLPAVGSTVCWAPATTAPTQSGYARKHNPWADFANVPARANLPLSAFPHDYATLPDVSFVIPNLCHDMHDCPVSTGDRWLQTTLGGYASWAQSHDSLLVVTFDEDDGGSDNRIATIFSGQHVRPGTYSQRIDHFTVLRTLEDLFGLGHAGAAARARAITGVWR